MKNYSTLLLLWFILNACGNKEATTSDSTLANPAAPGEERNDSEEDPEEMQDERYEADEQAYRDLDQYNGVYAIQTESEGVNASLTLEYKGERVFSFELFLEVADVCTGRINDEFFMDRTQHGFYDREGCLLHFNLVEGKVEIEEVDGCAFMKGECTFSSTWVRSE